MSILKDPVEVAEGIRAQSIQDSYAGRFVVFGDWCRLYGHDLPEIYVKAVAAHLVN